MMDKAWIARALGPILFFVTLFWIHPTGMSDPARFTLAATLWMAVWWVSESVPIAVTALLPLVLFPVMKVLDAQAVGSNYGSHVIFLFIACFMLATAIERWGLHRRLALNVILKVGSKPSTIILGFMLATGFLSMWLSNTATTIMMLPIGISILGQVGSQDKNIISPFSKALLLGIAYAASIGGIATIIGTPTNIIFSGAVSKNFGQDISFVTWMLFATPVSVVLLFACWYYLVRWGFGIQKLEQNLEANEDSLNHIKAELAKLGKISYEEIVVLIVFSLTALGWIARQFLFKAWIPNDSVIALVATIALFIIPAKRPSTQGGSNISIGLDDKDDSPHSILDWDTAVKIPWGVILLFGGGLALADAFEKSGLADWIGGNISLLQAVPFFILLLIIIAAVNFLTEITSNVATVSMVLPILIALSAAIDIHPYFLMVGATCAASCAFMLPVATAPNAIVFGTNLIKTKDMIRAGIWLNLISIAIFSVYIYFLMPLIWGIQTAPYPF